MDERNSSVNPMIASVDSEVSMLVDDSDTSPSCLRITLLKSSYLSLRMTLGSVTSISEMIF